MAAHRYWAITGAVAQVNVGPSYGYVFAVSEIEMRATAGGADQCSGGSVWSVGGWLSPPGNAFDDNPSNYAEIQGFERSRLLGYTFAAPVTVREVAVTLPPASAGYVRGSNAGPYLIIVQGSDDGTIWRTYASMDCDGQRVDGGTILIPVPVAVPVQVSVTQAHARASVVAGDFSSSATVACLDPAAGHVDPQFGGLYRIAGDVAIAGTPDIPVSRRVRLLDRETGVLVREAWSDPTTGAYQFTGLAERTYIAMADDHTAVYNIAVADRLVAVR